jgi:hypothetical protein
MTSPVGLLAVFANVVILLVLAAALASPRLSQLARLVISTFAFLCAWLVVAVLDAMHAPSSTVIMGGAVIVASIVGMVATLHCWTQAGDVGEPHPEHRDDGGGGGPGRHWPDRPQPGGGGSEPSWWPEFERRFALYVAERASPSRRRQPLSR